MYYTDGKTLFELVGVHDTQGQENYGIMRGRTPSVRIYELRNCATDYVLNVEAGVFQKLKLVSLDLEHEVADLHRELEAWAHRRPRWMGGPGWN